MNNKKVLNIVALGSPGVGKSALLNFISEHPGVFKSLQDENDIDCQSSLCLIEIHGFLVDQADLDKMVEELRELQRVHLFLVCIDGTNRLYTPQVKQALELYTRLCPEILHHSVIVFNKWTSADEEMTVAITENYQNIFEQEFNVPRIPCFFVDSFCDRELMRFDDDGERSVRAMHEDVQEISIDQLRGIAEHLKSKATACDVSGMKVVKSVQNEDLDEARRIADSAWEMVYLSEQRRKVWERNTAIGIAVLALLILNYDHLF
jgi:hypothetical protein